MKFRKIHYLLLSAVALMATACGNKESDEPIPEPETPVAEGTATKDVIYQVNPRFYGNDKCLKNVTADIPRIKSMNVNVLWIMPPFELGVEKAIGSPYCIKDFKSIDPKLGTMSDFKELVNTAHSNGMIVLLDWVANHTSFDNTWTHTNPERYKKDVNGNIAATPSWPDVAQLDYGQKSTREGMIDAMSYWVTEAKVDGFRCDHADGVPHDFWKEDIDALKKLDANIFMLAETNETSFYQDGFYMVYDWGFPGAVTSMYKSGNPTSYLKYITDKNAQIPEEKALLRYAFNHDVASENDVATMYTNQNGTILAYVLATFSGQTPMLYSSMDVEGLKGKLSFFSNAHRTLKFSDKLTKTYGDINKAYIDTEVARAGEMTTYSSKDAVIISFINGDKKLLLIANPSQSSVTAKTPIAFTGTKMKNLISGEEAEMPSTVVLSEFGYALFGI